MRPFLQQGDQEKRRARITQLKAQHGVGQKVSELLTDPRWELWGRHVEAVRESYQRKLDAATAKILSDSLSDEDFRRVKLERAKWAEAVTALTTALTIAKTLIENGEKAAGELKEIDSKEQNHDNDAA